MANADTDVRIISIYATPWRFRPGPTRTGGPTPTFAAAERDLPLSPALEEFHYLFSEQMPQLISREQIEFGRLDWPGITDRNDPNFTVQILMARLFRLPSDQVVATLDLEYAGRPLIESAEPAIRLLDGFAFSRFTIDGEPLGHYIAQRAVAGGCELITEDLPLPEDEYRVQLPPERHQIVFAPAQNRDRQLSDDTLEGLLYRNDPQFRREFSPIREPVGLNPGNGHAVGRVTPFTTLLVGHDEHIENSVILTAVQAVGTGARFRQIWHEAHGMVRRFRATMQEEAVGVQTRDQMENLADRLGNLELELSFSVDTSSDLGLLLPTLRSTSFHHDLYAVLELEERAERVSGMFTRLSSSIHSELTAIGIREDRRRDQSRLSWTVAINTLSVILVPVTVLLAFFGINGSNVDAKVSILNLHHYAVPYLAAVLLAGLPLITFTLVRRILTRVEERDRRARAGTLGSI